MVSPSVQKIQFSKNHRGGQIDPPTPLPHSRFRVNHSKLQKFIQNGQKFHKTLKGWKKTRGENFKENQGWNVLYIRGYDVTYASLKS